MLTLPYRKGFLTPAQTETQDARCSPGVCSGCKPQSLSFLRRVSMASGMEVAAISIEQNNLKGCGRENQYGDTERVPHANQKQGTILMPPATQVRHSSVQAHDSSASETHTPFSGALGGEWNRSHLDSSKGHQGPECLLCTSGWELSCYAQW